MAANLYMASIDISPSWAPLATGRTVMDVTLITPESNFAAVSLRGPDGSVVSLVPGTRVRFTGVDLSTLEVQGAFDTLKVIAQTR